MMYGRYDDDWGMHDGIGWAGWLMMVILVVLLVAILVVALLALLGKVPGPRGGAAPTAPSVPPPSDAERLLDQRFAAGEIDEEEYRRRRGVLHGG